MKAKLKSLKLSKEYIEDAIILSDSLEEALKKRADAIFTEREKNVISSKSNKYEEYQICKRRGHEQSLVQHLTNPPQNICKWCGTIYRYETNLIETNTPNDSYEKNGKV